MRRLWFTIPVLALSTATLFAQAPAARAAARPAAARQSATAAKQPLVEFEMMTWPEVKAAMAAGRTTALVYTGGTEQRGPQNVNGGHTLMGREVRAGRQARLLLRPGLREGARRLRQMADRARLSEQLARRDPRHFDDALSRRGQGVGAQGADRDRGGRSGSATWSARPRPRGRSERAAAQE